MQNSFQSNKFFVSVVTLDDFFLILNNFLALMFFTKYILAFKKTTCLFLAVFFFISQ